MLSEGFGFVSVDVYFFCTFLPCDILFYWADDRKRYTATIPRHRAVQQNTPRFSTPIRDADWSTQSRTRLWHQLLAVHHAAAFQLGRHHFLTKPITLSGGKFTMARF